MLTVRAAEDSRRYFPLVELNIFLAPLVSLRTGVVDLNNLYLYMYHVTYEEIQTKIIFSFM